MSTHLERIKGLLCGGIVHGYQEFMIYIQSHPIDEMEIDIVEGSNNLSEPLPRPSESVQHVRILRNKRANLQSPSPSSSFHPRWVRGNNSDTNVLVN
ncbi:hypothetical protein H5410_046927 [Solanum commersonii]|uniref:Uncharacterized protein n=1 Tax=Solanum commersonii TaxID=4109 RepID=A0A9J5XFN1_SOLCO|nr:hypothetical protein H5410_046927 [Solanum commersonii]